VTEGQIYHRAESDSQTKEDSMRQIESQEMWGEPARNNVPSHIPKVKAWINELSLVTDPVTKKLIKEKGIEFTTMVEPDRCSRPHLPTWSNDPSKPDRDGVRTEDGYAKIKVRTGFCNQVDQELKSSWIRQNQLFGSG
jgi:hypothetical protein